MGLSSLGTGVALSGDRRTVPTPSGGVMISRYIPKTSRCLICRVSPGAAQGFRGLPVLLESGYLSANDVHAFLTTWFVSPRGQIAFAPRKLHPRSWCRNLAGAPRRCSGKTQVRGVEGEHAFPPNADRTGGADRSRPAATARVSTGSAARLAAGAGAPPRRPRRRGSRCLPALRAGSTAACGT